MRLRRAIIGTEVAVATAVMGLLAVVVVKTTVDYYHLRDRYTYRQAAAWAADAQLQRYRAGAPFDSRPPADLVPEHIALETRTEVGRGDWEGFTQVTVIATATLPTGKGVNEEITGYLPAEVTR